MILVFNGDNRLKVQNLPPIEILNLGDLKEDRKAIIFTDKIVWEKIAPYVRFKQKDIIYVERPTETYLSSLVNSLGNYEVVYGIGGGVANDVAKFIGFYKKVETVSIPTIFSTDAFLTSEVGVRVRDEIKYFPAKHPDIVYVDLDVISKAPKRLNLCGCGDILSIYTGLFDWKYTNIKGKIAEDEKLSLHVYYLSQAILRSLEVQKDEIRICSKEGLKAILDLLCMEVQLCYLYGNSRPEEGSEHYFTYLIENITKKHFLHGEMVALGTLIMSYFQGQDYKYIKNLMDYIGLNYLGTGATRDEIIRTIQELPNYVKEKKLRYSYAHDLIFDLEKVNFILKDIGIA
jgi:glycerol-1-phosphate dehydrogenase [NAD(P)+]